MKNFLTLQDEGMNFIDKFQGLSNFAMQIRNNIVELKKSLPEDGKYDGLRECLEDSEKSIKTTIKKLCKGYSVAFDLELEV